MSAKIQILSNTNYPLSEVLKSELIESTRVEIAKHRLAAETYMKMPIKLFGCAILAFFTLSGCDFSSNTYDDSPAVRLAPVGGVAVSNYSTMGIGGKVSVSGLNGLAVYNTGNLTIQGSAEILAIGRGNLAIRSNESGTVSMSHGIVFGYGATDANIIDGAYSQQSGGTNVIIAWNNPIGNPTYTAGTSDSIFKLPSAATAVWSNKDGKAGIDYAYTNNNNENKGFIAINGITVTGSSSSRTTSSSSSVQTLSSSSNGDPTPIRPINNTIVLENLPAGTKIEVYNLQGKRIYLVQTKGIYIIKQTSPANTHSQYFRLSLP